MKGLLRVIFLVVIMMSFSTFNMMQLDKNKKNDLLIAESAATELTPYVQPQTSVGTTHSSKGLTLNEITFSDDFTGTWDPAWSKTLITDPGSTMDYQVVNDQLETVYSGGGSGWEYASLTKNFDFVAGKTIEVDFTYNFNYKMGSLYVYALKADGTAIWYAGLADAWNGNGGKIYIYSYETAEYIYESGYLPQAGFCAGDFNIEFSSETQHEVSLSNSCGSSGTHILTGQTQPYQIMIRSSFHAGYYSSPKITWDNYVEDLFSVDTIDFADSFKTSWDPLWTKNLITDPGSTMDYVVASNQLETSYSGGGSGWEYADLVKYFNHVDGATIDVEFSYNYNDYMGNLYFYALRQDGSAIWYAAVQDAWNSQNGKIVIYSYVSGGVIYDSGYLSCPSGSGDISITLVSQTTHHITFTNTCGSSGLKTLINQEQPYQFLLRSAFHADPRYTNSPKNTWDNYREIVAIPPEIDNFMGSYGSGNGQFINPWDADIDSQGNLYVLDSGNNRIQKFSSDGIFISSWGSYGTGNGQLAFPWAIAIDSSDNVYVAEVGNTRIQKFTSDGTYITKWGTSGSGNGQFDRPSGIGIDSLNNLYVVDVGNERVQKFTSGGSFLTAWGSHGSGNGQFYVPTDVVVDEDGIVYVIEAGNDRVQKFDSSGTYLAQWGQSGAGDGDFWAIWGIDIDRFGFIYILDTGADRMQKFLPDGTFLSKWGSPGSGIGQFDTPRNLAIDFDGNIFVVDSSNNRIQIFSP